MPVRDSYRNGRRSFRVSVTRREEGLTLVEQAKAGGVDLDYAMGMIELIRRGPIIDNSDEEGG